MLAAIHPFDRQAWLLENILLVRVVGVGRGFVFAVLRTVIVPSLAIAGVGDASGYFLVVGQIRRHVFLAFPVRELLLRFSGIQRAWSFWLPPAIILAISGFFEILESIVAETVAPGKGVDWLGGQGDEWDAQNDMLAALLGAFVLMAAVRLITRKGTQR